MQIAECNYPAAENISRIIKEKGLKQVYVATGAGYSPQEFNDMLNGRKIIKVCDIPRITKVLKCSWDDIYKMGREVKEKGEQEDGKEQKEINV